MSVLPSATSLAIERAAVDFSVTAAPMTHRASGFLHSIDAFSPSDQLIAAVKPQLYRDRPDGGGQGNTSGMFNQYNRLKTLGVKHFQVVVSDGFNGDYAGPYPGDNGDWLPWENYVTNLVVRAKAANMTLEYDIWNEPDIGYFWRRDAATFRETWKRAVQRIRLLDPQATIVGPSFASYGDGVKSFLLNAKADSALPDVLAWHAFGSFSIPANAADARAFMTTNGINISRISLNEIVGTSTFDGVAQWQNAGPLPRYFLKIEQGDIESAAHACWGEPGGGDNCENGSLNGLLTSDTKAPRSTYWVYERYGRMSGNVSQFTQGVVRNAAGLMTFDGLVTKHDGVAHVLFGRTRDTDGSDVEVLLSNLNQVPNLVRGGVVRVTSEAIANSKTAASAGPIVTHDRIMRVTSNQLLLPVHQFGKSDAYFLTLHDVPTWTRNGDGEWSDSTAWAGGAPAGVASAARFGPVADVRPTVTINTLQTVGLLLLDNPSGYRITGNSTLTINNGAGTPIIEAAAGANDLDVAIATAPGAAAPQVTVADGASLKVGGGNGLFAAGIDLGVTGALDLTSTDLLIDYSRSSPAAQIRSLLQRGRGSGDWDGAGIRSSDMPGDSLLALGYADAGDIALSEFAGHSVDSSALLIKRTYAGDADLNGRLDGDDYFRIDSAFASGIATWITGDFDYNNRLDADDYFLLDRNLGRQTLGVIGTSASFGSASAVPEPGAAAALLIACFRVLPRRRRA